MKATFNLLASVTMLLWSLFVAFNSLMAFEISYGLGFGLLLYALTLAGISVGVWLRRRGALLAAKGLSWLLVVSCVVGAVVLDDVRWVALVYGAVGAVTVGLLYLSVAGPGPSER